MSAQAPETTPAGRDWWGAIAFSGTLAVTGLLVLGFAWLGAWHWLVWGALGWGLGLVLKGTAAFSLHQAMEALGPRRKGLAQGFMSAVTELGMMAALLWVTGLPGGVAGALALGVGAGCLEVLMLAFEAMGQKEEKPAERPAMLLRLAFPVERLLVAMPLHVGARGLIVASAMGAGAWAAAVAVACFTVVDGLPGYGEAVGWKWTEAGTLGRYYALAGAVGWGTLGLAMIALLG